MKVAIVGGGIMGLSTAWGLARLGHAVTLYEQDEIPNPRGSSFDRHRLIRHAYGEAGGYTRMVDRAYAAWDVLWTDLGTILHVPTGTLVLASRDPARIESTVATFDRQGRAYERLDGAAVAGRFPALRGDGIAGALHIPSGGVLLADTIVGALARHLADRGVAIRTGARVADVDCARATVRLPDGRTDAADAVVVAAGPWLPRLLPGFAARVTPSRQVTVRLHPPPDLAAACAATPMLLDLHGDSGFYMVPPVAGTDLKIGDHGFTLAGDPDGDRVPPAAEVGAILAAAARRLAGFERYTVLGARACFYTVESQERLVVEPVGRAWVVSPCSGHGFKFAAAIGLAVADAVDGRASAAALTAWAAGVEEAANA